MAEISAARRLGRLRKRVRNFRAGVKNTLELLREGRLSAPYQAPFDIEYEHPVLRRGANPPPDVVDLPLQRPLLLVPPLMVAAEIYDLSPELSAVSWLAAQGGDVWLVDFGAPEHAPGGMERTLDDHVLAVDQAIDIVREHTGEDVHLAGYSQGGMFAYQVAAYRQSAGLASVITFGSPVDVHRNMPSGLHEDLAGRLLESASPALKSAFDRFGGLPGFLSMAGFKAMSGARELQQMLEFFRVIHDRERAEKHERQRRFLGGEGFVAWPGPALKKFIDEMMVNNRLMTGGLVIDGRPVTLADIRCPILYFVGSRDEFGRPPSVRAIRQAAPHAEIHEVELEAGHFGLVVGSRSLRYSWPTVLDWMAWLEEVGPEPNFDCEGVAARRSQLDEVVDEASALYDVATDLVDALWQRASDATLEVNRSLETLRWQLPRLVRIRQLQDGALVSLSRVLAEQAVAIGEQPFFLWEDRSYSYAEADERVNQLAAALAQDGVRRGQRVAILMDNHPDYLSAVCALNRIGAVAVLLNATARGESLRHALTVGGARRVIVDAAHRELTADCDVERLYGFEDAEDVRHLNLTRELPPPGTPLPASVTPDAGRAEDLALLIFTSGTTGLPKAVKISNRRWVAGALGAAAATRATTRDTVLVCLPLYHATGIVLAVGGALVGGARMALLPGFSATLFWSQLRRYGATIVVYVGELCRYLVTAPATPGDRDHPVRAFCGNGLRAEVWRQMLERFAPEQIIEFYASSEGNVQLVNLSGEKIGCVGRPLVEAGAIELVRYDTEGEVPLRDADGWLQPCDPDEPGLLISRIDAEHPLTRFDGYVDGHETEGKIIRDAFESGDAWFNSGDLLRRDSEGDYWFVDRIGDTFRWHGENVSTQQVADVLDRIPAVAASVVYGIELPGRDGRCGMAAIALREGHAFDADIAYATVTRELSVSACPRVIRLVPELATTDTLKFVKRQLQAEGADPAEIDEPLFVLDEAEGTYRPLQAGDYPDAVDRA